MQIFRKSTNSTLYAALNLNCKSFAFEKRALESDKKHAEEMADAKIKNLESQVEALTQSNAELSNKLDAAYAQMKDMATATVQAGATVKVVSSDK